MLLALAYVAKMPEKGLNTHLCWRTIHPMYFVLLNKSEHENIHFMCRLVTLIELPVPNMWVIKQVQITE